MAAPRHCPSPRRAAATAAALTVACAALVTAGCLSPETNAQAGIDPPSAHRAFVPTLSVSHPPFEVFEVSWMQRLDQPYVYVDHYGSYTDTGAHLPALIREMRVQGIEPDGPPFCLFYDDPAKVEIGELRSRACVPISTPRSPKTPLGYDVLPSRPVCYAYVSGVYPDVPRAYPKMFEFMSSNGWVEAGPIRETYIVPPAAAASPADFLCEIQIPFQSGG